MKRRLNVLCLLVILVLGITLFRSVYHFGTGASAGFKASKEYKVEEINKLVNMLPVTLQPIDYLEIQDSVYNSKTREYVPAYYRKLSVSLPSNQSPWNLILQVLLTYIHMFAGIAAFVFFILIIVSVNKSRIFTWKNVSRLRWLGAMLIISFLGMVGPLILIYLSASEAFSMNGYIISLEDIFSVLTLALGLVSYIIAEVFAIGLRLQEEQELTI